MSDLSPKYSARLDDFDDRDESEFLDLSSDMLLDYEDSDEEFNVEQEPTKPTQNDEMSQELKFVERPSDDVDDVDGVADASSGSNMGSRFSDYNGRPLPFPISGSVSTSGSVTISSSTASVSSSSENLMEVESDTTLPLKDGEILDGIRVIKREDIRKDVRPEEKHNNEDLAEVEFLGYGNGNAVSDPEVQIVGSYDSQGNTDSSTDVKIVGYKRPRKPYQQIIPEVQIIGSYEGFKFVPYGEDMSQTSGGKISSKPVSEKVGSRGPKKGFGGRPPLTRMPSERRGKKAPSSFLTPTFNAAIPPPQLSSGMGSFLSFSTAGLGRRAASGQAVLSAGVSSASRGRGDFFTASHGRADFFKASRGRADFFAATRGRSITATRGRADFFTSARGRGGLSASASTGSVMSTTKYIKQYVNKGEKLVAIVVKSDKFHEEKEVRIKKRVDFRFGVDSVVHKTDGSGLVFVLKTVTEDSAPEEIRALNAMKFDGAGVTASRLEDEHPDILPSTVLNLK